MSLTYLPPQKAPAALRAGWVMVTPDRIEPNACLETRDFRVTGLSKSLCEPKVKDLGPGVLMPLLVNAHTHLELSALKGKLDPSKGFDAWVKQLMAVRQSLGPAALAAGALKAIDRMHCLGTGTVADISTLGLTRAALADKGIAGIWFQEVLGDTLDPGLEEMPEKAMPLSFSLAGHAPHTTSPQVLWQVKTATQRAGLPFSIHVAESQSEGQFLQGKNRSWEAFLSSRGIDTSGWPLGDKTSVAYLDALGLLGPDTLGVHLIDTSPEDLDRLADTGTRICLCPRSNHTLHGRLPDIRAMLDRGMAPALGTDSLASCDSLSLFDEMAFVRARCPDIDPKTVLKMAGMNGAAALGLSSFMGALDTGYWAGCLYVDLEAASCNDILERLTANEP